MHGVECRFLINSTNASALGLVDLMAQWFLTSDLRKGDATACAIQVNSVARELSSISLGQLRVERACSHRNAIRDSLTS